MIELLAVIVILGILMLIAIPSVTRYINQSRKKSINELVETVRYGVISEDSEYAMGNNTERTFALKDIPTEKGDTKDIEGYVKVIKTENGYEYKVKVNGSTIDSKNYCCDEVDIKNLENSLEKCSSSGSSEPREPPQAPPQRSGTHRCSPCHTERQTPCGLRRRRRTA